MVILRLNRKQKSIVTDEFLRLDKKLKEITGDLIGDE